MDVEHWRPKGQAVPAEGAQAVKPAYYWLAATEAFYTGFELDADAALAKDEGPDPDAAAKGDSHYYVFHHTLVRAYRDGTTSTYVHLLAKVLTEEGVNFFDVYRPPFNRPRRSPP